MTILFPLLTRRNNNFINRKCSLYLFKNIKAYSENNYNLFNVKLRASTIKSIYLTTSTGIILTPILLFKPLKCFTLNNNFNNNNNTIAAINNETKKKISLSNLNSKNNFKNLLKKQTFLSLLLQKQNFLLFSAIIFFSLLSSFVNTKITNLLSTISNCNSSKNLIYSLSLLIIAKISTQTLTQITITFLVSSISFHLSTLLFHSLIHTPPFTKIENKLSDVKVFSQNLKKILSSVNSLVNLTFLFLNLSTTSSFTNVLSALPLFGCMYLYGIHLRKINKLLRTKEVNLDQLVFEVFGNIKTVTIYGNEEFEYEKYKNKLKEVSLLVCENGVFVGVYGFFVGFICFSLSFKDFGEVSGGFYLFQEMYKNLMGFSFLFGSFVKASVCLDRINRVLLEDDFDGINCVKGRRLDKLRGEIEFKNLSLQFGSKNNQSVFDDLNFKIKPGECVVIIGKSGVGKSTILNLIEGFFSFNSEKSNNSLNGEILIDGVNINDLDMKWLRSNVIGYITQEPVLFNGISIKDNILYGREQELLKNKSATETNSSDIIEGRVNKVIKQANCEFVYNLSNGIDTIITSDMLSGGQKQRLSIARALLLDPKILLFDECTSNLDYESEGVILSVIDELSNRKNGSHAKSVVVVTHKVRGLKGKRVVCVGEGGIKEDGIFEELVKRKGAVWMLFGSGDLE